jgi:hypothetical protein
VFEKMSKAERIELAKAKMERPSGAPSGWLSI